MSERGSFVTEYLYCEQCFKAAKKVLSGSDKYFTGIAIPSWNQDSDVQELPIIAGKIGGLYPGEELDTFKAKLVPALAEVICHPLRIAVIAEQGEKIFTINPKQD